jgi:hypothetical protein
VTCRADHISERIIYSSEDSHGIGILLSQYCNFPPQSCTSISQFEVYSLPNNDPVQAKASSIPTSIMGKEVEMGR